MQPHPPHYFKYRSDISLLWISVNYELSTNMSLVIYIFPAVINSSIINFICVVQSLVHSRTLQMMVHVSVFINKIVFEG